MDKLILKKRDDDLFFLVANNDDDANDNNGQMKEALERAVSYEELMDSANRLGAVYYEVSVKHGRNCEFLFQRIANDIIDAKLAYCKKLVSDKNKVTKFLWFIIFIAFLAAALVLQFEIFFATSLFILLSLTPLGRSYTICQTDPLPYIASSVFTLAFLITSIIINIILCKKLLPYRKRLLKAFIIVSAVLYLTLIIVRLVGLMHCSDYIWLPYAIEGCFCVLLLLLYPIIVCC